MRNNIKITLKQSVILLSIGIYSVSLTQDCYCVTDSCGNSFMALIMGIVGLVFGGANLTWLANPILFISWSLWKKNTQKSMLASGCALIFMISFLFFKQIVSDEAGNYSNIVSYKLGYWLWLLSALTMFIGAWIIRLQGGAGNERGI
ncbi:hypothetical protein [Mucilaginibacter sp. SJ]|uniref:hypothetical protein n=1 Tax=Mucilaginibacter sp. SJ TaxID=3029053 RepID=UPI0023A9578C|nr:hypothetical protein [Mucilaginibacter sp. SJ]WEA03608.1 hypothetical protein MusilaSJ_11735 [Mucilaginibacter sp. SJ]